MAAELRTPLKPLFSGARGDGTIGDTIGMGGLEPPVYAVWDGADGTPVTLSSAGGHGGARATGTATRPALAATLVNAGTGFSINLKWDSSVGSAPAAFQAAVVKAATYLVGQFSDAVTINLNIGWGEVGGSALGSGALAQTSTYLVSTSYAGLVTALKADATSAADASAVASLPASAQGAFWLTTAEARALGLAGSTSTDADIGFSSSDGFTFDGTNGIAAGTYDFNGVALHEMTETMGRILLVGDSIGTTANSYDALDMFHFSAPGVRTFSGTTAGYFSVDNGTTNLAAFNTVSGADAGDWSSVVTNDAADAFATPGVVLNVSDIDLTVVDAVGWNRVGFSTSVPTGITMTPVAGSLASLQGSSGQGSAGQGSSGLAANGALATIRQTGGATADSYSFALDGAGASAFKLTTTSNVGTLAAGSAGVAGAAGGRLYALTVTPKDVSSGNAGPASPLDVIVGSTAGDTVAVATLTSAAGAGSGTPSFVYGLAGADTIDATGMTGTVMIAGGAGADRMTGGSGLNDYMYGAAGESTVSAMDVIANFHSTDLIDLTGLGTKLAYAGAVSNKLAARSVGWGQNGGNTFVYVNTTSKAQALGSVDMKIELLGTVTLTGANITHL